MTGLEAAFAALVLAALTRWLNRVRKAVMFPWTAWRQSPDPAGVRQFDGLWAAEVDRLVEWLDQNAVQPSSSHQVEVNEHLTRVRNYLVRIPDEVFDLVRIEIQRGQAQGDPIKAVAERIDSILTATGSENWDTRARTIAVTEVNGASNAGWFAGAVKEQQQRGQLRKRWIATHDSHTRLDHREADGQEVALLSPFIVGTWPLLYPGDKNGPPDQVINCRCTAAVVEER